MLSRQQSQDTRVDGEDELRRELDGDEYDDRRKIDSAEGRGDETPHRLIEWKGDRLYEFRTEVYSDERTPGENHIDEHHPLDQGEENEQGKKEYGHRIGYF